MDILIIGGTRFLGRHLAETALARGHGLTLFHRGQTGADLFPAARHILGDRQGDLSGLADGRWDAVIDTCGYRPADVRAACRALEGRVGHYSFISSISVYADGLPAPIDEEAPVRRLADADSADLNGETYGALKTACEEALTAGFPGPKTILRPGLIVGPQDPTDRFTYWPWRIDRGGAYVVPADPDCPVQVIDARDLANWTLDLVEAGRTGTFNAVGPRDPLRLGQVLEACRALARVPGEPVPLPESRLLERGVSPFTDLPLWLPKDRQDFGRVSHRRALAAGLRFRPLAETLADTLAWARKELAGRPQRAGLTAEREQALLLEAGSGRGTAA
jgi:2'-hydroxyisoflavone reductase